MMNQQRVEGVISSLWVKELEDGKTMFFLRLQDDEAVYSRFGGIPEPVQEAFESEIPVFISYIERKAGGQVYRNIRNITLLESKEGARQEKLEEKQESSEAGFDEEVRAEHRRIMLEAMRDAKLVIDEFCGGQQEGFNIPFNPSDIAVALFSVRARHQHYIEKKKELLKIIENQKKKEVSQDESRA